MTKPQRIVIITTGMPEASFVACALCGVLLWDEIGHYKYTHPDVETSDL